MNDINLFKKTIKKISGDKLIETFSKGALKLKDEQINTVSFVFWLCYMAETDLNDAISQAWNMAKQATQFPNQKAIDKIIKDMGFDFENLKYFRDKIKVFEKIFGKTERVKILWKINDIRNDLSHNRIDNLTYDSENLSLRKTKEKITIDYFETSVRQDYSKSKIWNGLKREEQDKIEKTVSKFIKNNKGLIK